MERGVTTMTDQEKSHAKALSGEIEATKDAKQ